VDCFVILKCVLHKKSFIFIRPSLSVIDYNAAKDEMQLPIFITVTNVAF